MDLELAYRDGRLPSRTITTKLRGMKGTYGSSDASDSPIDIEVVGTAFEWERRMTIETPGMKDRTIKLLCPWVRIYGVDRTSDIPLGYMWVRLGDPELHLLDVDRLVPEDEEDEED
jgi:hypothetical protein